MPLLASSVILATYPEPLRSMVLAERVGQPQNADLLRDCLARAERLDREARAIVWYSLPPGGFRA